MVQRSR